MWRFLAYPFKLFLKIEDSPSEQNTTGIPLTTDHRNEYFKYVITPLQQKTVLVDGKRCV